MDAVDRALVKDQSKGSLTLMVEWHPDYPGRDETRHWGALGLLMGKSYWKKRYYQLMFEWKAEQSEGNADSGLRGSGSFVGTPSFTGGNIPQSTRPATTIGRDSRGE